MNGHPTIRGIDHVHVFVADRAQAQQWYLRVLGFMPTEALQVWAADGGPLTLQNPQGTVHVALFERAPQPCRSTVAFDVAAAEFRAWKAHLGRELGHEPVVEDHGLSISLYFDDPDGNPYEITTYEVAAAKADR